MTSHRAADQDPETPLRRLTHGPLLYGELSEWWPLVSAPEDYAEEAGIFADILREHCCGPARTLLELGSGGGNNASHMKRDFEQVTLVDLSPGMLDVSRTLNPECEHRLGDMRSVRLDRLVDCVFVHDAICYATTTGQLRQVAATAMAHLRPGGAALFVPDYVRESFTPSTRHGGHDGNGRSLRYLEWTWDPDPTDETYLTDFAFLLRGPDGRVRVRHDRHEEGLFPTAAWLEALAETGFTPQARTIRHSQVEFEMTAFIGMRE